MRVKTETPGGCSASLNNHDVRAATTRTQAMETVARYFAVRPRSCGIRADKSSGADLRQTGLNCARQLGKSHHAVSAQPGSYAGAGDGAPGTDAHLYSCTEA